MHETAEHDHISLNEAARIAPGDVSPNCIWRWCRRGVLSRSGERIKLQHVRVGGKLFTTAQWIEEFGQRLAEADADYFDRTEGAPASPQPQTPRRRARRSARCDDRRREELAQVRRELEAEGL